MPAYLSFDPAALINGASVRSVLAGLRLLGRGPELLLRHGLPESPTPGQWYSMQAWLNVLRDVEQEFGQETLYAVGLQVVEHAELPPSLTSLPQALRALDLIYRTNVHGRNMGYYRVVHEKPTEILLHCRTPNPPAFERGIITGLTRRFKPADALRVRVEEAPTRPDPADPHLTAYVVNW